MRALAGSLHSWPTLSSMTVLPLFKAVFLSAGVLLALKIFHVGDIEAFRSSVNNINVFLWGTVAVAYWRLSKANPPASLGFWSKLILFLAALSQIPAGLFPGGFGFGVPLGIIGAVFLYHSNGDNNLRASGICLLAVASHLMVAPFIFRVFLVPILAVDNWLLQSASAIYNPAIQFSSGGIIAPDGTRTTLVGGCSSFGGISAAILVHVGWAMKIRTRLTILDGFAIALTGVLATTVNITRLLVTTASHESYLYWHGVNTDGLGLKIMFLIQTVILLTGGYVSAYWAGSKDQ
jgi:hypothetical protein